MSHKVMGITMIYTDMLNRGPLGVRSPADLVKLREQGLSDQRSAGMLDKVILSIYAIVGL